MALTSEEIRAGIVSDLRAAGVPEGACAAIAVGLTKTCSLNRQCYSSFSVQWNIAKGNWSVNYVLDDFGRETRGVIGGVISDVELTMAGTIDPMPPDSFRRKTEQPVPQPRPVKAKADDGVGMSLARKGAGKRKMA